MLHDVPEQINQFLQHADNLVNQCGSYLQSPILVIDPVIRRIYEHMEYRPWSTPGPTSWVPNDRSSMIGFMASIIACCAC